MKERIRPWAHSRKAKQSDEPYICGRPNCGRQREFAGSSHSIDSMMIIDQNNLKIFMKNTKKIMYF